VQLLGAAAALAATLSGPGTARAAWMEPDPQYREAQMLARIAARDTVGHGNEAARFDSLGSQLMKLGRLDEAHAVYSRAAALDAKDTEALAALGKIALFHDRLTDAEHQLAAAGAEPGALEDLLDTRERAGDYTRAAELADQLQQQGRAELLRAMAAAPVYQLTAGPARVRVVWVRAFPVPLVRVKINGEGMLMALDTGASGVLLDPFAMRRCKVKKLPSQRTEFWTGSRVAVSNAMVQRLEIGGMRLERVPAGVLPLRKWSLEVNPYGEQVAGVIGLEVLKRFTPTLDYANHLLELERPTGGAGIAPGAPRIPFELWGTDELTVYGSINGGRRMAMVVQTGVPTCGLGATHELFEEVGIRPGMMSRITRGAGQWLQGHAWTAVVVPTITLGPVAQDRVAGCSGALDPSEVMRHGVRRDALLAGDFFRDRRMTIDWQAHEIVVEN
jgi:tetratricopeptide (TPR) repeat protein